MRRGEAGQGDEKSEISLHEARVFLALRAAGPKWLTSQQLSKKARVSARTARAHLLKLTKLGLLDAAELFPAHRYRLAQKADKRNGGYLRRLTAALEMFGMDDGAHKTTT